MKNPAGVIAAVQSGDAESLRAQLAQDPAAAAAVNEQGVSAIMLALYHRKADILQLLLAAKPDLNVFEATATGNLHQLAQLLDAHPALLSSWSGDGFTALHFASFFAQEDAAQVLLKRGADSAAVARNPMQVMPLHSAVTGRNVPIVRALLERGAPPNPRQQGGWTPLHAAAQNGDPAMVRLLLDHGADRTLANDEGVTALDLARKSGFAEIVQLLSEP
jgi:ankyrin repeat protein